MPKDYSTQTDLKQRWGGLLENPYVSKAHRHLLDGFKVRNLARLLEDFDFDSLLDVGCGLGEYSLLKKTGFVGIDNSFQRVRFAQRWFESGRFCQADAVRLPFKNNSFDAVLLANTLHHLSDEAFFAGLAEMRRVTRRYLIVDDCVRWDGQPPLSRFFYNLDRGTMFRTVPQINDLLTAAPGIKVVAVRRHRTFPGLYEHSVFILTIN